MEKMNTEGKERHLAFIETLESFRSMAKHNINLFILTVVLKSVIYPILQRRKWKVNNLHKVPELVNREASC